MPETGTSGSMSGDGKRSVGHRPQVTAPILNSTDNDQTGDPPRRSKRTKRGHQSLYSIASPARFRSYA